jgi:hypothetical protein
MVLQTSSFNNFNKTFSHLKRTIEVVTPLTTRTLPRYPAIEELLWMAEKLYLDISSSNEWTGETSKGNQAVFNVINTGARKLICWNCDTEGHSLRDCPKPTNQQIVEKNKKLFQE